MKQSSFTTIVLKTENEDGYLTNANDVLIENRVLARMIALGKNDSVENYIEISADQAEEYKKAQEEARKAKLEDK